MDLGRPAKLETLRQPAADPFFFPKLLGMHKLAELLFQPAGLLILLARRLRLVQALVREPEIEVGLGQRRIKLQGVLVACHRFRQRLVWP